LSPGGIGLQPPGNQQITVFGRGNSLRIEVNNAEVLPGMDFAAAARIGPAFVLNELCRLYLRC
jgi:hypothetical protein